MSDHDDERPMTAAELNAYLAESVRLAEAERERAEDEDDNLVAEGQVSG